MKTLLEEQKNHNKGKEQKYKLKIKEQKQRYKQKIQEYEVYIKQLKSKSEEINNEKVNEVDASKQAYLINDLAKIFNIDLKSKNIYSDIFKEVRFKIDMIENMEKDLQALT